MESYFLDDGESGEVEKLDLRRYYRALVKRWWLIILVMVVVTIPWFWYLKQQPPIYEAQARIQFKNYSGSDVGLAQARTLELTSRSFAEKVVAQLGLALRVENQGDQFINRSKIFARFQTDQRPTSGQYTLRFAKDQTYQLTRKEPVSGEEKVIKTGYVQDVVTGLCEVNGIGFQLVEDFFNLPSVIVFNVINFRSAVESFQARVDVEWEDRSGTLMDLRLTDTDPMVVAEMTNRLATLFIAQSTGTSGDLEAGRRDILEKQLQQAKEKLADSDLELKTFKERHGVNFEADLKQKENDKTALERERDDVEDVVRTLNDLLIQKVQQTDNPVGADPNRRTTVRFIVNQLAGHAAFDNNAAMLVVRDELQTREREWADIANGTSPQNFRAKRKLQEILKVHSQVERLARQGIAKFEAELSLKRREIATLDAQLRRLPAQQLEFDQLSREHSMLESQYKELNAKHGREQVSKAAVVENIKILDNAIPPEYPTNRDKKQKAAFGGIFGLFMGIGLVLVIEFMDKTIKTADDVKHYLRLPILGTIPQIDFEDTYDFQDSEKIKKIDQQLVTHDYAPTPIGEAYRSLRTNLMFTKDTGRIRSFALTSNEPGDGKSFTAANLTIALAQLKSSTLLIDSDLRRGVLHNTFGVPKEPGFSNYLTDVVPLHKIIHETQIPNLSVISCGSLIPNPSELLGSHQMQRFLDEVRRKYDLIVFDTPPLNAATDAIVVGTQVDAVVLVLRAGKTQRALAKSKLELFSSVPAKLLGAILNGTTADMAHPGYSYYHY